MDVLMPPPGRLGGGWRTRLPLAASPYAPIFPIRPTGIFMGDIKAILFDMDGVLIDAKDWHYEALNHALSLFGMEINRDAHLSVYDGLPTRKKLEILSRTRNLPAKLQDLISDLKQQHTVKLIYSLCKPIFSHRYALSRLRAEGYRIAVCSNSIRYTMDVMLDRADLLQFLEFYLSNEDVTRPKPDPEIYLTAMTRMGLSPDCCLVVEDNENGIKSAKASGAYVLEVGSTVDVTYDRISRTIAHIAAAGGAR
jgi:HAD superfamily hydrolase (TIGR01509 family)